MATKIKKGTYKVADLSAKFLKNKVVPAAEIVALISDIPGINDLPGVKAAGGIAKMVKAGSGDMSKVLSALIRKDNGTGSCWIRSKLRHFQFTE